MTNNRDEAQPTSYLAFANILDPPPEGRFAGVEPRKVVGAYAIYEGAPPQPGSSPWSHDPVPDESPLGIEIDAPINIGEPSPPQPCPSPTVVEVASGALCDPAGSTSPAVERRGPANLSKQRRRL